MKKKIVWASVALPLSLAFCSQPSLAADATSFDPTKVQITAKATSSIPVGTVVTWPSGANPADMQNPDGTYNWLECNGQSGTVRRHRGESPGLPGTFPARVRATDPYPEQRQYGGEYGHHARQRRAWQGAGGCHQRSRKFVCYLFAFRVRRYVLRRTYVRRIQDGSNQRGSMGRFMAYELAWIESFERASAALRQ